MQPQDARELRERPLQAADWHTLVSSCSTEEEIVRAVRDYLATWTAEEIARLPVHCRPRRIRDGDDISEWAFELASALCAAPRERDEEALLEKLLSFVKQAAIHHAEVRAKRAADGQQ